MLEWLIGIIPLVGVQGNWRGYRMGGKAIGGDNMSTALKKKFEAARAAGNMDEAKRIADKTQSFNDAKKGDKAKTIVSGASNNVDIKIAGKEISVPPGVEIVATMSQPPVGSPYRVMPKGGSDNDFIREKARGNFVPVLQFKTAQAAQNYADKINKAMDAKKAEKAAKGDSKQARTLSASDIKIKPVAAIKNGQQNDRNFAYSSNNLYVVIEPTGKSNSYVVYQNDGVAAKKVATIGLGMEKRLKEEIAKRENKLNN